MTPEQRARCQEGQLRTEVKRLTRLVEIWQQQAADVDTLRCAEIEGLQAALWCIVDMCPATAEVTLAHQMADVAMAVLGLKPMTREPVPNAIADCMLKGCQEGQLRAEVEQLLDALKAIECHSIDHTDACRMAGKARTALENKQCEHEWYRPDWMTAAWEKCRVCGIVRRAALEFKPMTRDEPYPAAFIGPVGPIHRAEVTKERAEIEQLRAIGLELLAIAERLAPADYSIAWTQIDKARAVLEPKSKS